MKCACHGIQELGGPRLGRSGEEDPPWQLALQCGIQHDLLAYANGLIIMTKCGLSMRQLQQLETSDSRMYDNIVPFFEENGITQSFHAPSAEVIIEGMQFHQTPTCR